VYADLVDAVENAVKVTETISPEKKLAERYAELFGIYRELYPALHSSFKRIHALTL
jgi:sugar (pentulose or hexulose) kinase